MPKANSKSNSENEAADQSPYVQVKLTKEVLHQFEQQTHTSTYQLIEIYLQRCDEEEGSVEGLFTTSSSADRGSSSSDDESENVTDENDDKGESSETDEDTKVADQ